MPKKADERSLKGGGKPTKEDRRKLRDEQREKALAEAAAKREG